MRKKAIIWTVLSLMSLAVLGISAQERSSLALDPAGYVNKYNTSFEGIGPEVYVLPAPRTKQEILRDSYGEKGFFSDTISHALRLRSLLTEFKRTENADLLIERYKPFPSSSEDWNMLIKEEKNRGNLLVTSGLLNEYARLALQEEQIEQAIGVLLGALEDAESAGNDDYIGVIRANLASIYLFNRNFKEAAQQQEALLSMGVQNKSLAAQADAHVKLAVIQAHLRDYALAENTIIRKAIPIYNRTKNYGGKIAALQHLAVVYQMQQKHTQAQWFLLQARDIATARNFLNELAEIEYMLASSKVSQENYRIALKELETAKKLAKKDNNELLELAIMDKLGDVHLILANYEQAESELESYWQLRNRLFSNI